jgi:hypothetical protein
VEIARVRHAYAGSANELEIQFFAAEIASDEVIAKSFESVAWVLPKELSSYEFLSANSKLIADLATGRIKPREIIQSSADE